MKNNLSFLFIIMIVVLASCKKPDACVNATPTNVKLGQEVLFTDCSTNGKSSKIDFGDNSKRKSIEGSIKYAYTKQGSFAATLTHYNKSEKKEDEAMITIVVDAPTQSELTGSWRLTQEEEYSNGFTFMDPGSNEVWNITSGTFDIDGGASNTWSLSGQTFSTSYGAGTYRIVKLYDNALVLRYDEFEFFGVETYSAYHFVKL